MANHSGFHEGGVCAFCHRISMAVNLLDLSVYILSVILDFNFPRVRSIFDHCGLIGSFSTTVNFFVDNI